MVKEVKEALYNCPSCRYDCAPGAKDELTRDQLMHCDHWEAVDVYDDGIRVRSKEECRRELRTNILLHLLVLGGTVVMVLVIRWMS